MPGFNATMTAGLLATLIAGSVQAADLVQKAAERGQFTTLIEAMDKAGLTETVAKRGPFTLFAPTDEAFAQIPRDEFEKLLADKARLQAVLSYHLVPGRFRAENADGTSVKTVQGQSIKVERTDGMMVGKARVIEADIEADNGVIHVIDTVILPR